jgi:hypothetical protein
MQHLQITFQKEIDEYIGQLTVLLVSSSHMERFLVWAQGKETCSRWPNMTMPLDGIRFTGDSTNGKTTTGNHV